MLTLCAKCYLEEQNHSGKEFMISPLYTPKNILKQHSKTYLIICENDPLHDDALRYYLQLL